MSTPKTREEFLNTFLSIAGIAEDVFNKTESIIDESISKNDMHRAESILRDWIALCRVISGLRGDKTYFVDDKIRPFFVIKDGVEYSQTNLYGIERGLRTRTNDNLEKIRLVDESTYLTLIEFIK